MSRMDDIITHLDNRIILFRESLGQRPPAFTLSAGDIRYIERNLTAWSDHGGDYQTKDPGNGWVKYTTLQYQMLPVWVDHGMYNARKDLAQYGDMEIDFFRKQRAERESTGVDNSDLNALLIQANVQAQKG